MNDHRKELPVIAGFILPNRVILQAAGIGHCKVAREYLEKVGLYGEYRKSNVSAEDDYLIEYLGAIKVAAYRGVRYIYIPRIHGWYLNQIAKMYIRNGFKPLYMNANYSCDKADLDCSDSNYNTTVIRRVTADGKVEYCYNPLRNGD